MIIKIKIKKIMNTCIMFDSHLYNPINSNNMVDFYEIPCQLHKKYGIKIIHYSGTENTKIGAVIDCKDNNIYRSIIKEMKSLDIDLYYYQLNATITVSKTNSEIVIDTVRNEHKDIIGHSSYCDLKIVQLKNVSIDAFNIQYYPSNKTKYAIFFVEIFSQLLAFIVFFAAIIICGEYCIERWHNPGAYAGPYPFFLAVIPMAIVSLALIVLELKRVAKHTLLLNSGNAKDNSSC